ncbi:MAG TPA: hypothetical protein VH481_09050 [Nitrososphaeraceae archaeon]
MVAIAVLSIGIAGTTATLSNMVYADATTPNGNNPNEFGQSAKDNAPLGDHSKAGSVAGDPPYDSDGKKGRSGIGNIGNDLGATCGSKHQPI